jgi:hypothetical protein
MCVIFSQPAPEFARPSWQTDDSKRHLNKYQSEPSRHAIKCPPQDPFWLQDSKRPRMGATPCGKSHDRPCQFRKSRNNSLQAAIGTVTQRSNTRPDLFDQRACPTSAVGHAPKSTTCHQIRLPAQGSAAYFDGS